LSSPEDIPTAFSDKVRELEETKQKEKAYLRQIVVANNVLRRMPQEKRFIVVLVVKGSKLC
jgi:hypothetical protein